MVSSPCINLCQMDPTKRLCRGCFRTLDEISAWSRLDDSSKAEVLAIVAKRRAEAAQTGNSE